jgi:hypothetical protein
VTYIPLIIEQVPDGIDGGSAFIEGWLGGREMVPGGISREGVREIVAEGTRD